MELKKKDGRVCIGFVWLKKGTGDRLLLTRRGSWDSVWNFCVQDTS